MRHIQAVPSRKHPRCNIRYKIISRFRHLIRRLPLGSREAVVHDRLTIKADSKYSSDPKRTIGRNGTKSNLERLRSVPMLENEANAVGQHLCLAPVALGHQVPLHSGQGQRAVASLTSTLNLPLASL
jgi:hypothetical protein